MTDRPTVFQVIQIGKETDYGTAVAADIVPVSFGLAPRIRSESQTVRIPGYLFNTLTVQGREWTELPITGQADYNELVYLLASLLVEPTPSGAGTAKTWLFDPTITGGDTKASFTVEHGDSNVDAEVPGVMVNALTLELTRQGFSVSGSAIGQLFDSSGGLTAAQTPNIPHPIEPKFADVFLDALAADLGDTQLERVLRVRWQFGDVANPIWPLLSDATSFAALIEGIPSAKVSVLMQADAAGLALLTNLRNGASAFLRVAGTSDQIAEAAATYYGFSFDTCIQINDIAQFSDENGVYALEFSGNVAYDGTWEKALAWTLVNTLAAI